MPLLLVRSDITKMRVDAIVNAANPSLLGGGGVDGAIHRAAGPELLAECRTLGGCKTGEAKVTAGYKLPAKYVIHTVGPVWHGGTQGEPEALASCYKNSLLIAEELGIESIAFPLISAGVYGYPKDKALRTALFEAEEHLKSSDITIYIVLFESAAVSALGALDKKLTAYIDDNYVKAHSEPPQAQYARQAAWLSGLGESMPVLNEAAVYAEESCDECAEYASAAAASAAKPKHAHGMAAGYTTCGELERRLSELDESFSRMLLRKIDEKGMTDSQCYKRANIDRKLFSKIRSDANYRPRKPTALAFAIALELSIDETRELLRKAGFALSHSSKFDVIIEYFILNGNYNIYEINETLFSFDQPLLGS